MSKNDVLKPEDFEFTIAIETDDGEIECAVIDEFSLEDRDYAALLPLNGPDAGSDTVYLYRASTDRNGEMSVSYIEDDEEYENVADAYDELLDEEEYESLMKD